MYRARIQYIIGYYHPGVTGSAYAPVADRGEWIGGISIVSVNGSEDSVFQPFAPSYSGLFAPCFP
jgi:hypothetical protein